MLDYQLLQNNLITAVRNQPGNTYDFWTNSYVLYYMLYASQAQATMQTCLPGNSLAYRGLLQPIVTNTSLTSFNTARDNYDSFVSAIFLGIQVYWQPVLFSSGGFVTFDGAFLGTLEGCINSMKRFGTTQHSKEDYIKELVRYVDALTRKVYVIFTLPASNPLPPNYIV